MTIANLDYGFNWSTDKWDIYPHGESPVATVDTEECAALFASAPGQAAEITKLEARAVDINNELKAEERAHDFTKSNMAAEIERLKAQNAALLEALDDCTSFIDELTHDLVEIETGDPMSGWFRPAMDLLEKTIRIEVRLKREARGDEAEPQ